METQITIILIICMALLLVGGFEVAFQIYHMTIIDANMRGLKHPKMWGIFTMSGNNSGGLLMYLIGRRKYPVVTITEENQKEMRRRKKSAGAGVIFLAVGAIGMAICIMYL